MYENGAPIDYIGKVGNWASKTVMDGYIRPSNAFRQNCVEFVVGKDKVVEEEEEEKFEGKKGKEEVEEEEDGVASLSGMKFSNCGNVQISFGVSGRKRKREEEDTGDME